MGKHLLNSDNTDFEHQQWKKEIAFWKEDLESFKNKLSELLTRWTSKEVLGQIEYYQCEFIIHGGLIEDLTEAIAEHEMHIVQKSNTGDHTLNAQLNKKHIEFRNKIDLQREEYAHLKKNFFRFLGECI